jgi:hypothetical protein
MQKYRLTITDGKKVYITKDYCYLSRFDFKVHSSVLFLLSAEKDKKKPDKDFISKLQKELKIDLDTITDNSQLFKYLDKKVFVKDYYGDKGRIYKLEKL